MASAKVKKVANAEIRAAKKFLEKKDLRQMRLVQKSLRLPPKN